MTTPSLTKRAPSIHVLHTTRIRNSNNAEGAERIDRPYDLAGTAYRVVLGCCTQEDSINQTSRGRLMTAKPTTPVRAKEVKS